MTNYIVDESNMGDWKQIAKEYCKQHNLTLLFVNDTSFGAETANGDMMHIYIDELMDLL